MKPDVTSYVLILALISFSQNLLAQKSSEEEPAITLTPPSLDFGEQVLATPSNIKTVMMSNDGAVALSQFELVIEGYNNKAFEIADTTTCRTELAAGEQCEINIVFNPSQNVGTKEATLTVTSTALTAPLQVALTGIAINERLVLTVTPMTLQFGKQTVNTTSAEQIITMKNKGQTPMTKLKITLENTPKKEFEIDDNSTCTNKLEVGEECQFKVVFKPTTVDKLEAKLIIEGGNLVPTEVKLTGTGIEEGATPEDTSNLSVTPTKLSFGEQAVNSNSAEQTVTLTNDGPTDLGNLDITLDGTDFELADTSTCQDQLAAGEECQLQVIFKPSVVDNLEATLTVTEGSTITEVKLTGIGIEESTTPVETSNLTVDPTDLSFEEQTVDTSSAEQTVTLSNEGSTDLSNLDITLDGTDFELADTSTCEDQLAVGEECLINIIFKPTETGELKSTLTVTDGNSSTEVNVMGTGIAAETSNEVNYPVLGNPAAVNNDGQTVEAPIMEFQGGIAITTPEGELGEFQDHTTLSLTDKVTIGGRILVPSEHIGETADFFAIGFYSPTTQLCSGQAEDGAYYMMTSTPHNASANDSSWHCPWHEDCSKTGSRAKDFAQWNGQVTNLQPFATAVLQDTTPVELIDNSQFNAPGLLCITFGYRLQAGDTVFFPDQSIDVTIEE